MHRYGVLVISHGSRERDWVRLVDAAVADMRLPAELPVYSSFLEIVEGRLIQDGIRRLEAQGVTEIVAVPLFVSSGSTHIDEIAYALGVTAAPQLPTELTPFARNAGIRLTAPLDDDEEVADIVYDRVRELSADPEREAVLLIGHGSAEASFRERWQRGLEGLARRLQERGGFAETDTALLLPDQTAERLARLRERRPSVDVIAAPVFLSEGYFTRKVIPERLRGYAYRYNGKALLPHPLIARWLEKRVRESLERFYADNISNG